MKAYLIDADKHEVREFEYSDYRGIAQFLPGGLCLGAVLPNGDVLYVDDEALLRPAERAFRLSSTSPDSQPMMSHGVVTGPDSGDTTMSPQTPLTVIAGLVQWLTVDEAIKWFEARQFEACMSITDSDGTTTVISTWNDILKNLEAP